MKWFVPVFILAWLSVGTAASVQRGYFGEDRAASCNTGATIGLTMLSGPVNYVGVDPRVSCRTPHPST